MARTGTPYLALELRDRTGAMPARTFRDADLPPGASTAGISCASRGRVERFRDELQPDVAKIARAEPGEADPAAFLPVAYRDLDELDGFLEHTEQYVRLSNGSGALDAPTRAIAMALALQPKLLIADEPTTALDVTTQAQVLESMAATTEASAALLLITHNLGVVAGMVHRVNVMYAGVIVETGTTEAIFERPRHPYTIGLLHSIPGGPGGRTQRTPSKGHRPTRRRPPQGCPFAPRCAWRLEICSQQMPPLTRPDGDAVEPHVPQVHAFACHNPPSDAEAFAGRPLPELGASAAPPVGANAAPPMGSASAPTATNGRDATPALLRVDSLQVHDPARRSLLGSAGADVRAVDGISFTLRRGETLGLVGESGSGKSTTGRAILRLTEPTAGTIMLDGTELTSLGVRAMHARLRTQMIFQDPYASLNPRKTVSSIVREPLDIHAIGERRERRERARKLLSLVGKIDPTSATAIRTSSRAAASTDRGRSSARAQPGPDRRGMEPISALDVSMQAQILELLETRKNNSGSPICSFRTTFQSFETSPIARPFLRIWGASSSWPLRWH